MSRVVVILSNTHSRIRKLVIRIKPLKVVNSVLPSMVATCGRKHSLALRALPVIKFNWSTLHIILQLRVGEVGPIVSVRHGLGAGGLYWGLGFCVRMKPPNLNSPLQWAVILTNLKKCWLFIWKICGMLNRKQHRPSFFLRGCAPDKLADRLKQKPNYVLCSSFPANGDMYHFIKQLRSQVAIQ